MRAPDFRLRARSVLRGQWGNAILVAFVASLLGVASVLAGGTGSAGSVGVSLINHSGVFGSLLEDPGYIYDDYGYYDDYSFDHDYSDNFGYDYDYGYEYDFDYGSLPGEVTEILKIIITAALIFLLIALVVGIALFVIRGVCRMGYAFYTLQLADGQRPGFSVLFSQFRRIGSGIGMEFMVGLYTALWSLLLVIPGLIKFYSYSMTSFILAENPGMRVNDAITRSRQLMKGNKWRLFCLSFSFIGWKLLFTAPFLLGSALFISGLSMSLAFNASAVVPMLLGMLLSLVGPIVIFVGQLFILPYENTAFAVFYRQICWERAHPVNHDPRR